MLELLTNVVPVVQEQTKGADPNVVLPVLIAMMGSSVITGVVLWLLNRGKDKVDTAQKIVEMYDTLLDELRNNLKFTKEEVAELRRRETAYVENSSLLLKDNIELRKRVEVLEKENALQKQELRQLRGGQDYNSTT